MNKRASKLDIVKPGCRTGDRQGGFSLIELMVSMTLGLLIMAGVLALYLDLSRSNAELAKMNRQIENGRFTLQLLQQELWRAGFWDIYMPPLPSITPPTAIIPNPCLEFSSWDAAYIANLYAIPVQGYAAGTALPAECPASIEENRQPSSDVLIVRYAATCAAGAANCEKYNEEKIYLQTQGCVDTAKYVASAAIAPVLGRPLGTAVYKKDCTTPADKRKLIVSIFYIRNFSVAGDGIPTLMRADFDLSSESNCPPDWLPCVTMQSAQPVIEGIQSIKFEYGQDTNEDGTADIFNDCSLCTALNWANVVAVRMHVLARNLEASSGYVNNKTYQLGSTTLGPFNDGFMRHVYTSYVHLVNPAGRREKP